MGTISVNISSNYTKQGYIFGSNIIIFDRIYCGVAENTAVVLGEERFHGVTNYYLLADVVCKTFNDLIRVLSAMKRIKVNEFFWNPDKERNEILTRHHIQAFRSRKPQLFFSSIPSDSTSISSEWEAITTVLDPKHLWLFNESRVPAAIQSMPTDYTKLKAEDYPLVAALGYALTMLFDIPILSDSDDMQLSSRKYGG